MSGQSPRLSAQHSEASLGDRFWRQTTPFGTRLLSEVTLTKDRQSHPKIPKVPLSAADLLDMTVNATSSSSHATPVNQALKPAARQAQNQSQTQKTAARQDTV